jgi:hypothetical protein
MNCFCGIPAVSNIVKSSNSQNFGKPFIACGTRNCKFFQFIDEPPSNLRSDAIHKWHQLPTSASSSSSSTSFKKKQKVKIFLDSFNDVEFKFWCGVLPSDPSIASIIQALGNGMYRYSESLKLWLIDFTTYESFMSAIQSFSDHYEVEEIPKFLAKGISNFLKHASSYQSEPVIDIPLSMKDKLLPFQLDGVKFVVRRNGRALIGK